MTTRKLRPVNLTARERMELGLLLPLIGTGNDEEWELDDRAGADAAIVDTDADDATAAIAEARRVAQIVITVSETASAAGDLHLTRPLRSQALVRVLAGAQIPSTEDADFGAVRLLRWPPTDVLRSDWRLARVCGALGRGPQSVEEIAYRIALEASEVAGLLEALAEAGCTEAARNGSRPSGGACATAQPPRGLLARLRARLGRS